MQRSKWQLCKGGYHLWPKRLKAFASRCCCDCVHKPSLDYAPHYLCTKGRHCWSRSEDAERCCKGFVPIWKTLMSHPEGGFTVREMVLVPASTIADMDELASKPGEKKHLYLPI